MDARDSVMWREKKILHRTLIQQLSVNFEGKYSMKLQLSTIAPASKDSNRWWPASTICSLGIWTPSSTAYRGTQKAQTCLLRLKVVSCHWRSKKGRRLKKTSTWPRTQAGQNLQWKWEQQGLPHGKRFLDMLRAVFRLCQNDHFKDLRKNVPS